MGLTPKITRDLISILLRTCHAGGHAHYCEPEHFNNPRGRLYPLKHYYIIAERIGSGKLLATKPVTYAVRCPKHNTIHTTKLKSGHILFDPKDARYFCAIFGARKHVEGE